MYKMWKYYKDGLREPSKYQWMLRNDLKFVKEQIEEGRKWSIKRIWLKRECNKLTQQLTKYI